ncbi:hypothetical protein [Cyclobacterium plantarum]|nr:hypothetical protein [Cyclobacterium plantarum]
MASGEQVPSADYRCPSTYHLSSYRYRFEGAVIEKPDLIFI